MRLRGSALRRLSIGPPSSSAWSFHPALLNPSAVVAMVAVLEPPRTVFPVSAGMNALGAVNFPCAGFCCGGHVHQRLWKED